MEVLQGEGSGVVVALFGFGDILGEEIVGQVAVDSGGQGVVAGLLPGVEWRFHDMAVDAGSEVLAKIGQALAVAEGEAAQAEEQDGKLRVEYKIEIGCAMRRPSSDLVLVSVAHMSHFKIGRDVYATFFWSNSKILVSCMLMVHR